MADIDYLIVTGDKGKTISVDTREFPFVIQLPAPVADFSVTIKDATGTCSARNITVLPNGSEQIDKLGTLLIARDFDAVTLLCDGTSWSRSSGFSAPQPNPDYPRALFGGGTTGSDSNVIDTINIAVASNATLYGSLTVARNSVAGFGSGSRAFFAGGSSVATAIDYLSFVNNAGTAAFGVLNGSGRYAAAALASATRGVIGGGNNGASTNDIQYVTMASLGNSVSFGNLTSSKEDLAGAASPVRGLFAGGNGPTTAIDYVTIATAANATSFSTMSVARLQLGGCSNSTRAIFAGGNGPLSSSDLVIIAVQAVGTSFGALTQARRYFSAAASPLRAVFGGGLPGSISAVMDYYTFANASAATSFGNLTVARYTNGACSNSHGGL